MNNRFIALLICSFLSLPLMARQVFIPASALEKTPEGERLARAGGDVCAALMRTPAQPPFATIVGRIAGIEHGWSPELGGPSRFLEVEVREGDDAAGTPAKGEVIRVLASGGLLVLDGRRIDCGGDALQAGALVLLDLTPIDRGERLFHGSLALPFPAVTHALPACTSTVGHGGQALAHEFRGFAQIGQVVQFVEASGSDMDGPEAVQGQLVESLFKASQAWTAQCPPASFNSVPRFTITPHQQSSGAMHEIAVDYRHFDTHRSVNNENRIAEYQPGSRVLTVYGRCSALARNAGLTCKPDNDGYIDWNSPAGQTLLQHEIGHALGLGHDITSGTCSNQFGFMRATDPSRYGWLPNSAYCNAVQILNCDPNSPGGEGCPGRFKAGGTVTGLEANERVDIKVATIATAAVNEVSAETVSKFGSGPWTTLKKQFLEGATFNVTITDISNENKICTVAPASGVIGGADFTGITVTCTCKSAATSAPVLVSYSTDCPSDNYGGHGPFEPLNICRMLPDACNPGGVWWDTGSGPWGEICFTVCDPPRPVCDDNGTPGDESDDRCSDVITCVDKCISDVVPLFSFHGPTTRIDPIPGTPRPPTEDLIVTGFAVDASGIAGPSFYLDDVEVTPTRLTTGLYRPEACSGPFSPPAGQCTSYSGFEAAIPIGALTSGTHRLSVMSVDRHPQYPAPTLMTRSFSVCADATRPNTTITAPAAGAVVAGTVAVSATASDNVGVVRVDFYIDGQYRWTDGAPPYQFSWNTLTSGDGVHSLQSRAHDACGNIRWSASVSVTVRNDSTAPRLYIDLPAGSATVSGNVTIVGWATDPSRVAGLDFALDGVTLPLVSPYQYGGSRQDVCNAYPGDPNCPNVGVSAVFNSRNYSDGLHTLRMGATDVSGNRTTTTRQFYIRNIVTSQFSPVADAHVLQQYPASNFGTASSLLIRGAQTGRGAYSYLKFNVAGVGTVQQARLLIRTFAQSIPNVYAYRVDNNSWTETGVTWNTAPGAAGFLTSVANLAPYTTYALDVTAHITGNGTFTIGLTADDLPNLTIGSREYTAGANSKPVLEVTWK